MEVVVMAVTVAVIMLMAWDDSDGVEDEQD